MIWGAQLSMLIGVVGGGDQRRVRHADRRAAGYFRRLDNVLMRINDALMAFPAVLLAIARDRRARARRIDDVIIALAIVYTRAPRASCAPR